MISGTLSVDAPELAPRLTANMRQNRHLIRLSADGGVLGLYLYATRDELVALAERLIDIAVEMGQQVDVAAPPT